MAPRKLTEEEAKKHLFKRFWDKVLLGDGCWEWTAYKTESGYGTIGVRIDGVWYDKIASIVSWFLATGEWPTQQVCHTCDNPGCVRHSHHFEGTQWDNMQDCKAKGRTRTNPRGATCKRGHDLSDAYVKYGKRHCRICRKDWKRERRKQERVVR